MKKDTYAKTGEPRELSDADLAFLSEYTGEKDLGKLRTHVLHVWHQAVQKPVFYPCMQHFLFLQQRITQHEYYPQVLAAVEGGQTIRFLDVGTCFGQDTRQLIMSGMNPADMTIADLYDHYWNFGLQLFMDQEKMEHNGIHTAFGSFLDPGFVSPEGPLGHLLGRVNLLWANAVLHVFSEAEVPVFCKHAARMLAPGGVFFGTTMGSDPPSERGNTMDGSAPRFQHSAASLTALLKDAGFSDVSIKVKDPLDLYLGHTWAKFEDDGTERILLMFTAKK